MRALTHSNEFESIHPLGFELAMLFGCTMSCTVANRPPTATHTMSAR